jgi:hypothetical protein
MAILGMICGIFFGVAWLLAYFIDVEPVDREMSGGNPGGTKALALSFLGGVVDIGMIT